MVNQFMIVECVQCCVDYWCVQWYQEIRNIFVVGEGDVILFCQSGEGFWVDVMCWVYGEVGQWFYGGVNYCNQQVNQQRGQWVVWYVVVIVGQCQDDVYQDSGNYYFYCEGLYKIDVWVWVSGENVGQIEVFYVVVNYMVGGFIIEEKIVVKFVN